LGLAKPSFAGPENSLLFLDIFLGGLMDLNIFKKKEENKVEENKVEETSKEEKDSLIGRYNEPCSLCNKAPTDKHWAGQYFHKKCFRKLRKGAKGMI
jgi:hypothetical protein